MRGKKLFTLVISVVVCAVLGEAQSLVEVAQKEKERRESLKGRRVLVVTNEDLANLKKLPAIVVTAPQEPAPVRPETELQDQDSGSAPSSRRIMPRVSEPGPLLIGVAGSKKTGPARENLEEKLKEIRGTIGELLSRMNALREESFRPEAAGSREMILKQIDDLTAELLRAQQEEDNLRRQVEAGKDALKTKREPGSGSRSGDREDR